MYTLRRGSIQGGEERRLRVLPASSTAQLMHALVGQHWGGWGVQLRALPASSCVARATQLRSRKQVNSGTAKPGDTDACKQLQFRQLTV